MTELFNWVKWGGLIGIGIAMMFMLTFEHSFVDPRTWFYYTIFGLLAGVLITVGNFLFEDMVFRNVSARNKLLLLAQLLIRYIFSCALFYFLAITYRSYVYSFFPNHKVIVGTSLAVGIASVMVGLFWGFAAEKDERIKLEVENKKLAVVEERNRIARELHDSVSQNLFGISLNLKTLKYMLNRDLEKASETIDQLQEMVAEIQTEMRLMIYELQPVALSEKGFFEALENLAGLFKVRYNLGINCYFAGNENELDSKGQLTLYRVLQESLNNIARHANARKVKVFLEVKNGHGQLTIRDDGKGFELAELNDEKHLGVRGMRERVNEIGGEFMIESAPNKGTNVMVRV